MSAVKRRTVLRSKLAPFELSFSELVPNPLELLWKFLGIFLMHFGWPLSISFGTLSRNRAPLSLSSGMSRQNVRRDTADHPACAGLCLFVWSALSSSHPTCIGGPSGVHRRTVRRVLPRQACPLRAPFSIGVFTRAFSCLVLV